ncbi:ABC transporter ATP-binding protein [Chitinimonas taiwanensis]|jgi:lipoprotein-releasing system ATP-binding protein|uniref:Lipoprotein-releasing system ATP-binding protein n=1 Tax=Chitinimonas taiwanensis DSM 18899 TaxID=1121279 RepID=A0A1K2H9F6_9NEIS|nr:ABC transporter ATP-binding protein [Chitinimonas taiwanensis]SFZ73423.1 lipoprotein-releasing system ATP-binding protein [Chitinimonas taiwanensis DSM 18899]
MSTVLRARQLTRILPGEVPTTLVRGIDLSIEAGEFVCIMGPSGSGKSSLLYLLGLLDVPSSGTVELDGVNTQGFSDDQLTSARLAKLGFVFQFHFLLAEFTVLDNVLLPMRRLGKLGDSQARARATELLARLDVAEHAHKHPSQLSGGQRQRVAIARALANDPLVLLADEPTGNLDTASSSNVRQILHDLTREMGKSVLAVTHDPRFAALADRRINVVDGQLDPDWQPV